jgi:hypothetical protein
LRKIELCGGEDSVEFEGASRRDRAFPPRKKPLSGDSVNIAAILEAEEAEEARRSKKKQEEARRSKKKKQEEEEEELEMGSGKGGEMVKRTLKTSIFVAALLMSLFTSSLPLLISVTDVVASYILFSTLVCRHGSSHLSFRSTWSSYSFPSSLVDVPLLSLLRSLAMLCKSSHTFTHTQIAHRLPYIDHNCEAYHIL